MIKLEIWGREKWNATLLSWQILSHVCLDSSYWCFKVGSSSILDIIGRVMYLKAIKPGREKESWEGGSKVIVGNKKIKKFRQNVLVHNKPCNKRVHWLLRPVLRMNHEKHVGKTSPKVGTISVMVTG